MTDQPRGIRNNNALNVEYNPGTQWKGLDDPPTDGRFARFTKPEWGLRAALVIFSNYQKRGIDSLRGTIATWAPAHENNVDSYLGHVSKRTGISPETVLDLTDKAQMIAVLKAMVEVECGKAPAHTANGQWLDDAVFEAAYRLFKPQSQSRTVRGTVAAGASAAAGAVLEVAQDVIPQAADAAQIVTPIWPEIARFVLIGICIAGAVVAYRARTEAQREAGQ